MSDDVTASERRDRNDRRERTSDGRRGARRRPSTLSYVLQSLVAVLVLLGVIIFTVRHTRPVYATRGTVAEELRKLAPEAAEVLAPVDSTPLQRFLATEKFRDEKRNFYEDLMRTKQLDSARADSIATYAVREAYIRGISPAIIFGVMLTENARFISGALSNVGAVGLMQVYPKYWLKKQFTDSLGSDLASDSTNVRFGVFILSEYFNPRTRSGARRARDYRTALLRYNGCVRGTNTPHCKNYPDKVKRYVERSATSICDGRGFYECIAKPFMEGLLGEPPSQTTQ
ncbi:MAG TPA: transglycosylase SLT domain-containing protein [Gemmatimonadaceae bacterium]|nr:transglycosylase SLT domain-containing protein [Gemmatimonadaceae bacterium]